VTPAEDTPAEDTPAEDTPAEDTPAEALEKQMRMFWDTHHPMALKEAGELRRVLFAKVKHRVPDDLWIPGASQPGEEQHVVAVVSREHVLRQLQGVIELRHEWLEMHGLPLDCQMRDKIERPKFLEWARGLYEQEEFQRQRQAEDWEEGGADLVRQRKRSRWSREKQRRCGSTSMWDIISFSGKLDKDFLEQGHPKLLSRASAGASQPDAKDNVPQERTRLAHKARDTLRWAQHLASRRRAGRTRFSKEDKQLLEDYDNGNLLRQANDATKASGHGRLRNSDGTFQDIGGSTGGLARTVLDNWEPPDLEEPPNQAEPPDHAESPDRSEPPDQADNEDEHEDDGLQEEVPVSWPAS